MKIGHLSESLSQVATPGAKDAAPAAGKGQAVAIRLQDAPAVNGAPVSLSSAARSLSSGAAASDGDYDADKVNAMKQAIDNGTYKVDHGAIADKLLANARDVLRKVGS